MKKVIGRILFVVSVMLGTCLICYSGNSATYTQCLIGEIEYDQIIAAREENVSLLDGLRFNEQDLFFDKASGTFYYSLVEGSSIAFNPNVKIVSTYKDVQIAFLGGELTEEMIAASRPATVLVYTSEFFCCYDLICTTLPLMNIRCAGGIGNGYMPVEITVFDNRQDAVNRVTISSASIRLRGGASRYYIKPAYRLQLMEESLGGHSRTNQISLLGMRQDDDWILYAGYNDQEKVRNVFSSNLWKSSCASDNEANIDASMEYKYLELFINGNYWGLYALGYPIDKKQLGFGRDVSKEALYKTINWVDVQDVMLTENGNVEGYEQKGVDEVTEEGLKLLVEYYNNLNTNSMDSEKLCEWMDIDNAIDVYLFVNLIQGVDHAGKTQTSAIYNMYIAIMEDGYGGMKGLYIPWDMDRTWGNAFNDIPYEYLPEWNVIMESGYLDQIISNGDTDIWERIFDKYWTLRSGAWSNEMINSLLDQYETDIFDSGAYLRDMECWPTGIYADPADKLNTFRRYVNERLEETDLYYERMADVCQKSLFIRRSAEHKHFDQSRFLIEINNKTLLQDQDYVDLLEYIGIDVEKITDDISFIVAIPSQNSVEYFPALEGTDDMLATNAGTISVKLEENAETKLEIYTVKLDETVCYSGYVTDREDILIVFVDDSGTAESMNLWKPKETR